jgi:hypothetical protein
MSRRRPARLIAGLGLLLLVLVPATVAAQSAQSASLVGKVADESNAAIPGVTVIVRSPSLQVPQLTAVTGSEGDYRILELPPVPPEESTW